MQPDSRASIGIAAHITAASPGGPRYDETLTAQERGSSPNGIWLCDTHAREVDTDVHHFTVELLRAWKVHAEEIARAMIGRPIDSNGLEVSVELVLQRDTDNGLLVVGTTNLPDGTKIMGDLRAGGSRRYFAQSRGTVFSRHFLLGPFTKGGKPLPQRWYSVEVCSYFNGPWGQPKHVLEMVGVDGKKLVGRYADPLDPDLDETDYAVRTAAECPAPPLNEEAPLSQQELAEGLAIVQKSTLDVQGHDKPRSSESVLGVVGHFIRPQTGLREREGWATESFVPGIAEITYSFWNGRVPATAHWQVMVRSKEVRYRNRHAKIFSWLPDD